MISTYESLELAASSLIDAVNDCDMSRDGQTVRGLLDAVADTCGALGSGMAAHKARHRLAESIGNACEWYDENGGAEMVSTEVAGETVSMLAANARGLMLPWIDQPCDVGTVDHVLTILDDLKSNMEDVSIVDSVMLDDGDEITADERTKGLRTIAACVAVLEQTESDAAGGVAFETLAEEIEAMDEPTAPAILGRLAFHLDDQAHIWAHGIVGGVRDAVAPADDRVPALARAITEGNAASGMVGALDRLAALLRCYGEHEAAAVLAGGPDRA